MVEWERDEDEAGQVASRPWKSLWPALEGVSCGSGGDLWLLRLPSTPNMILSAWIGYLSGSLYGEWLDDGNFYTGNGR